MLFRMPTLQLIMQDSVSHSSGLRHGGSSDSEPPDCSTRPTTSFSRHGGDSEPPTHSTRHTDPTTSFSRRDSGMQSSRCRSRSPLSRNLSELVYSQRRIDRWDNKSARGSGMYGCCFCICARCVCVGHLGNRLAT